MIKKTSLALLLIVSVHGCDNDDPEVSPDAPKYPCHLSVPALQERVPGELIAWHEITPQSGPDQANFPAGARAWRIHYVSTGRDNHERTAVCGVIIAPDQAANLHAHRAEAQWTGRVVAWAHGTLGMIPRCQPSYTPESLIWGATPYGIGAVQWGSEQSNDVHQGTAAQGILAGMIEDGLMVAASDYYVDPTGQQILHPYALGKIEAANIIDSIRAGHQLLQQIYRSDYRLNAYNVVAWGHSQGAHAAMFTGQLLPSYVAATARPGDPILALSGVALEAAPALLVTAPERTRTALGFSHLDWLAHAQTALTGIAEPIPVAPFIFSYLIQSWTTHSQGVGTDRPDALPAYPPVGVLDPQAVISPQAEAAQTLHQVSQLCWSSEDGAQIAQLTLPYTTTPFLATAVSAGPVINGFQVVRLAPVQQSGTARRERSGPTAETRRSTGSGLSRTREQRHGRSLHCTG